MFSINTTINTFREKVELLTYLCYTTKARVHHFNSADWYIEIAPRVLVCFNTSCKEMNSFTVDFDTDYFSSNSNMNAERNSQGVQIEFEERLQYFIKELNDGYEYPETVEQNEPVDYTTEDF